MKEETKKRNKIIKIIKEVEKISGIYLTREEMDKKIKELMEIGEEPRNQRGHNHQRNNNGPHQWLC